MGIRERRLLLASYVDQVILRDIAERHQLTNLPAIRWMTRQLLGNAGGRFSANRFHRDLASQNVRCSVNGILEIYNHLEDAFLIQGARIESASERQRQVNPIKRYPIDPGLISVFSHVGRENLGHSLENCVFIELLRRGAEVTWVKTPKGFEVDFLARFPEGDVELVQVCACFDNPATMERESRALLDARNDFKDARLRLITLDQEDGQSNLSGAGIEVTPVYEWLLST